MTEDESPASEEDTAPGQSDLEVAPTLASRVAVNPAFLRAFQQQARIAFRMQDSLRPILNQASRISEDAVRVRATTQQVRDTINEAARQLSSSPAFDASRNLFAVELPKFDFSGLFNIQPFLQSLPKIDLSGFQEAYRRALPPNWEPGLDWDKVESVVGDDGIPLAWVPRRDLVVRILEAPDRAARLLILTESREAVVNDCLATVVEVHHGSLESVQKLAHRSVEALQAGHDEAAQALAVAVTETVISRAVHNKYDKVRSAVVFDLESVSLLDLRVRAALAPIYRFYTPWNPASGRPAPEALSRHVSVHQADSSHYTDENAVLAVMLVVSVLRAMQEQYENSPEGVARPPCSG